MIQAITDKLKTIVETQADKIAKVYRSEASRFDKTPCVCISPSDNAADFNDTATTRLEIAYTLRIYVPIGDDGEQADVVMAECYDQLIDIFQNRDIMERAGGVEWLNPVPGQWGYQPDRPDGKYRVAELKLRMRVYTHN